MSIVLQSGHSSGLVGWFTMLWIQLRGWAPLDATEDQDG